MIRQDPLEFTPMPLADHHGKTRPKFDALCDHQLQFAVRAQRKHLVVPWMAPQYVQGVDADGAGGAKHAHPLEFRDWTRHQLHRAQQQGQGQHG